MTTIPSPNIPTSTANAADDDLNNNVSNHSSCSALDLSWLSESVMEAALDTKNLSLTDIHHFQTGLKAAEEWGNMDMDCSERLHQKIETKQAALVSKMVKREFAQVAKRLQIYRLLKTHKTWQQVHYMADMHGQGAYILMKDFNGLAEVDVKLALSAFHNHMRVNGSRIPFSGADDDKMTREANARLKIQKLVAAKLCRTYGKLLQSLQDEELGGYDQGFLNETLLYRVEDLMSLWDVSPQDINLLGNDKKAEEDDARLLGDKTDDEDSEADKHEDEDATFRDDDDYDYYDDGHPAGRY